MITKIIAFCIFVLSLPLLAVSIAFLFDIASIDSYNNNFSEDLALISIILLPISFSFIGLLAMKIYKQTIVLLLLLVPVAHFALSVALYNYFLT